MTVEPVPSARRAPLVDRLPASPVARAAVVAAHERATELHEDGYLDPTTGWFVFTAQALWDRDACCSSGCRHCPYEDGPRAATSTAVGQELPGTE